MNYCFLFLTQLCYKSPSWHENPYAVAPGSWWGHRWERAGSSLPSGVGGLYLLGGGFNKGIHFKGDTVFSTLFLKCFQTYSQLKILRTKKRRHLSDNPWSSWQIQREKNRVRFERRESQYIPTVGGLDLFLPHPLGLNFEMLSTKDLDECPTCMHSLLKCDMSYFHLIPSQCAASLL